MTTLRPADTASLLLPVSNLTDLLALHPLTALGVGRFGYVELVWAPALAAVAATVAVLALRHRRAPLSADVRIRAPHRCRGGRTFVTTPVRRP